MAQRFKCSNCDDNILVLDEETNVHVCDECDLSLTVEDAIQKFEDGELVLVDEEADDISENAEFNGFANRQTWTANLIIQNDYSLFRQNQNAIVENDEESVTALNVLAEASKQLKDVDLDQVDFAEILAEMKNASAELTAVTDDLNSALAINEDLNDDQKTEIGQIFESALHVAVSKLRLRIEEETADRFDVELSEAVHDLNTQADLYLTNVAEEWFEENKIAIESGIKVEKTEQFIEGLHRLFEQNYIQVPEERFDILSDLAQKVDDLENQLKESKIETKTAEQKLVAEDRKAIVTRLAEGYVETDIERLEELAESIDYESDEQFESALKRLKESLIDAKNASTKKTTLVENSENDNGNGNDDKQITDPTILAAAKMLRRR